VSKKYDQKEKYLIEWYCSKIYQHTFDETDLFAFLILIRPHLNEKNEKYIFDFANLIAHRKRNRGVTSDAIAGAIKHNYNEVFEGDRKVVEGYHGVDSEKWRDEWKSLGRRFNYYFDDTTVDEISLCMLSILQFTRHSEILRLSKCLFWKKKRVSGSVFLLQSDNGQLDACTLEDGKTQPYICFFILKNVVFKKMYSCRLIEDPVITIRNENGELMLQNDKGERII